VVTEKKDRLNQPTNKVGEKKGKSVVLEGKEQYPLFVHDRNKNYEGKIVSHLKSEEKTNPLRKGELEEKKHIGKYGMKKKRELDPHCVS